MSKATTIIPISAPASNAVALCANCHRKEHYGPAKWAGIFLPEIMAPAVAAVAVVVAAVAVWAWGAAQP